MLPIQQDGESGTLIVMLHWLGGSSRSWTGVSRQLASQGFRCAAVDLPGFGDAIDLDDSTGGQAFSISTTIDRLIHAIRALRSTAPAAPWLLAGHSMGGKFAAILARHAEDGTIGLENLRGIVLVSPSPPSPEPMDDSKREQSIKSLGQRTLDRAAFRKHAEKFVDDNSGKLPLLDPVKDHVVADLLRMDPDALVAWMTTGSKEDWSKTVGVLTTPALILAGAEEKALGPEAQQTHTLPHFANAILVSLEGGGHLSPFERPWEIADRMAEFFHELGAIPKPPEAPLSPETSALIHSTRTSPQTRDTLLSRLTSPAPAISLFTPEERRTLRALTARIVPSVPFDLTTRLEATLLKPQSDGWRFNALPPDTAAWKQGLASLNAAAKHDSGVPFTALDPARQDALLHQAQADKLDKSLLASLHLTADAKTFTAPQMRYWFEDVRGELTKLYVADPRAMDRIGFTGFADEEGFTHIKLADQEEIAL